MAGGVSGRTGRRTAIDLFAGAGGATQGLVDAGFEVVAAVESESRAAASYELNHPGVLLESVDIATVDADALRDRLGLAVGELDLLKACPPCQGYSTLGLLDEADPRNALTLHVSRFLAAFRPASLLVENVPGIRRDRHFLALVQDAEDLGYQVRSYGVNATQFGVPQRRRRHIVIGLRDSDCGPLPETLNDHEDVDESSLDAVEALREALRGLAPDDPLDRHRRYSETTQRRIEALPVGGTRFDLPPEHQLKCHQQLTKRNATGSYSRIRAGEPAPTMTTRCTSPSCGQFVHPTENRGLTLREAAVLQTFPLTYRFSGDYGSIERQIGNAVPVRMAAALGRIVRELLDGGQP